MNANCDFTYEGLMEVKKEMLTPQSRAGMLKEVKRRSDLTKQMNKDLADLPTKLREKAIDMLLEVQGMYDGWGIC